MMFMQCSPVLYTSIFVRHKDHNYGRKGGREGGGKEEGRKEEGGRERGEREGGKKGKEGWMKPCTDRWIEGLICVTSMRGVWLNVIFLPLPSPLFALPPHAFPLHCTLTVLPQNHSDCVSPILSRTQLHGMLLLLTHIIFLW